MFYRYRLAKECREKFRVNAKKGDAILFYNQRPAGNVQLKRNRNATKVREITPKQPMPVFAFFVYLCDSVFSLSRCLTSRCFHNTSVPLS